MISCYCAGALTALNSGLEAIDEIHLNIPPLLQLESLNPQSYHGSSLPAFHCPALSQLGYSRPPLPIFIKIGGNCDLCLYCTRFPEVLRWA